MQRQLICKYGLPLVSFTMNIAGDIKRYPQSDMAFYEGLDLLEGILGKPEELVVTDEKTGLEAVMVYAAEPSEIKSCCTSIEDLHSAGRLFDMDVILPDSTKLKRGEERKCIVCGGDVLVCSRSRAHGLDAVKAGTLEILNRYCADKIGSLASDALMAEAYITPKPGLVDAHDSGAHKDMDIEIICRSADALRGYFTDVAYESLKEDLDIPVLKGLGIKAEKTMLEASSGVNTHKGAIYLLGLAVSGYCRSMLAGGDALSCAAEIAGQLDGFESGSHGDTVRKKTGITCGPKSEAMNSFPNVRLALDSVSSGKSIYRTLLEIMAVCPDSNVIYRAGTDGLEYMKKASEEALECGDDILPSILSEMNGDFIKRNISPGGCADILSCALFLNSLGET